MGLFAARPIVTFLQLGRLLLFVQAVFQPRDYSKSVALCNATIPGAGEYEAFPVNIHYVDVNPTEPKAMIMVHGWPGLWSTWSYQIEEFQDFRLLVPDLRGFGSTLHPATMSNVVMADLVADLACLLKHAQVNSAICVGHDWGSQVCYEAARMRPDIFFAVVGITVPYIPSDAKPLQISELLSIYPRLAYQVYFDLDTMAATAELDKDIRRTIRATFRSAESPPPGPFLMHENSYLEGWKEVSDIPPVSFLTSDEEDYIVEQYAVQGFQHTLHFYSHENRHISWQFANRQANHTIPQPVLSILPLDDPVVDWISATTFLRSAEFLPQLTTKTLNGAHWVHMENPCQVNDIMRQWLLDLHD